MQLSLADVLCFTCLSFIFNCTWFIDVLSFFCLKLHMKYMFVGWIEVYPNVRVANQVHGQHLPSPSMDGSSFNPSQLNLHNMCKHNTKHNMLYAHFSTYTIPLLTLILSVTTNIFISYYTVFNFIYVLFTDLAQHAKLKECN